MSKTIYKLFVLVSLTFLAHTNLCDLVQTAGIFWYSGWRSRQLLPKDQLFIKILYRLLPHLVKMASEMQTVCYKSHYGFCIHGFCQAVFTEEFC